MEPLLRRTLGGHIECAFALEANVWLTSVDPGQLTTALLNLVLNARDALPDGGKLTVEVRNASLGETDVDVNGEPRPGDYVMVAVTDTGSGMTAEVASRAFEPFFTTKEVGKGTGLGLSQAFGFAKQSEGDIAVMSTPGKGATFTIYLPQAQSPAADDEAAARTSEAATTGRGCGPSRRSSRSHSGGSAWSALSSAREMTPSWNSAGVAERYTPSFFAAVAGFIVWVVGCDFMVSRLSAGYGRFDHAR